MEPTSKSKEKGGYFILALPVFLIVLSVLLVLLLPVLIPFLAFYLLYKFVLYLLVWCSWPPRGKCVLFVYSNSPNWQNDIEENVLPRLREQAIVLNWSQRREWNRYSLSTRVFYHFAGDSHFNPMAIVFKPFRPVRTVRFYDAYRKLKKGNHGPLLKAKEELFSLLWF
jgi:hypothetical protein